MRKCVAAVLTVAAGLVVLVTTGLLTVDFVAAHRRLPDEKAHIDDLVEKVRTSADHAEELHTEWDRLTDVSLQREEKQDSLSTILTLAAVVFVVSSKWMIELGGRSFVLPSHLLPQPSAPAGEAAEHDVPDAPRPSEPACLKPVFPPGALDSDDVDLSIIDEIVAQEGRDRDNAIPILHAVQMHFRYLPDAALRRVCELTEITAARLAGVASFYTQFRRTPVGKHLVKVCHGTACHVAGAPRVSDELRRHLGIGPDEDTDQARNYTLEQVACMGCCTLAPVVQIDDVTHGHLRSDTVLDVLAECEKPKTNGRPRFAASGGPPDQGRGLLEPAGEIRIGLGSCCIANGSGDVHDALRESLATAGVQAVVKRVGCVGMCHQTPLIEINVPGRSAARYACAKPEHAKAIVLRHFKPSGLARRICATAVTAVDRLFDGAIRRVTEDHGFELRDPPIAAFLGPQKHIATEHYGYIDPTDLDEYLRHDGFTALERCLRDAAPEELIEQIRRSGLRGRGGAGFPTAEKWSRVREAGAKILSSDCGVGNCGTGASPVIHHGPEARATRDSGIDFNPSNVLTDRDQSLSGKYVICNGDEGDPGAFMDRMLMESYPYRIIEGVAIAAYAVGASEGFFYVRREYPLAAERIRDAIQECERRGLLGNDAQGMGHRLRLHIVEGAGAFVCGEETALIASIEGRRGTPTLRPPYPAQRGLWGRPTLVNNVETYAVVPWILRNGAEAFAALGTETSKGTKVFALAGKVKRGGLIEVPMGVTIREIVEMIGGGIKDEPTAAGNRRRSFKAVQIGGPSGGCVPAERADTPVDFEALAGVGAMMGSGGLVVLDETDCMVDIARYFLTFTQNQSCGKCTPCRVGTRRMLDILERLCEGEGRRDDLDKLEHLAHMVMQGSLCGLGKTAPNPVLTTLRYFRDEYEAHVEGRCPAGACKTLIRYEVTDACVGCTLCAQHCAAGAIEMKPYEKHDIDAEKCTRCDACRINCPEDAVRIV